LWWGVHHAQGGVAGGDESLGLVLLVANNKYQLQRASELGARDRLDDGVLQVSALRARTGAALARVLAKATVSQAGGGAAWAQWETTALRVDSKLPDLPAGVDGRRCCSGQPLHALALD
jgi:hypothetical protein